MSRLLRKKPLDVQQRSSSVSTSLSSTLFTLTYKTANAPLVIGYFVAFSYSALLAPSILPGVIFLASITSLFSELCKYEFLTCQSNTSTCPYVCVYQLLGELPAYFYGWLQLAYRATTVALLARGLGSILALIIGNGLVRHHYLPLSWVHEDILGITAQLIVSIFILGGLNSPLSLTATVKAVLLSSLLLFISVLAYFSSENHLHPTNVKISHDEQFMLSAALITTAFKPENKEPKLQTSSTSISVYLGVNHCINFLVLVAMSVLFCIMPISVLTKQQSSSPLLDILAHLSKGPHWFVITFACGCIFAGSLSLVEAVHDGRRHIVKIAADGLLFKQLARYSKLPVVLICLVSVTLEVIFSTFNLICIIAFIHLCLDATIGLIVAFRRYCTASPFVTDLPNRWKHIRRRFKNYEKPDECSNDSDSDNTDIDAAVDEYKTHVYVSTVMTWNGSEFLHRRNPFREENGAKTSFKIKILLSFTSVLILIISLSMRWIGNMKPFSIAISAVCFVLFLVILLIIWLHPQKLRTRGPVFKVPCVPWIPVGSALFHCVLLFQLPGITWTFISGWLIIGLILYVAYGYRNSRLNFIQEVITRPINTDTKPIEKKPKPNIQHSETLLCMPQDLINISSSSIAVYPQPYHQLA